MFAGEWHPRLTYLLTTGGMAPAKARIATLPAELAYAGSTAPGSPASGQLRSTGYDGTTFGTETTLTDATNWSSVAGVVLGSDRTYRFLTNGAVEVSPDGTTWTTQPNWLSLSNIRAAAYAPGPTGRAACSTGSTVTATSTHGASPWRTGSARSLLHRVSGPGVDGTDWTGTNGLTVIADKLYHVHTDGTLRRTDLVAGRPVMATTVTVSGPTVGGLNWANTVALHTRGQAAPPPPPPPDHLYENHFDDLGGWTTLSGLTLDTTAGAPAGAAPSASGRRQRHQGLRPPVARRPRTRRSAARSPSGSTASPRPPC